MSAGLRGLAVVLALTLFGYAIWTTDRLSSLAPVTSAFAATSAAAGAPPMSRRLAACCHIVMAITMG
jgi:hypothetical protein